MSEERKVFLISYRRKNGNKKFYLEIMTEKEVQQAVVLLYCKLSRKFHTKFCYESFDSDVLNKFSVKGWEVIKE